MAYVETYRKQHIYFDKARAPGPCYWTELLHPKWYSTLSAIKKAIDAALEAPPPPPPPPPPPTYECPTCGATFSTQAALDAHIASAHPPPQLIETFRGVKIYWLPKDRIYWAQVATGYVAVGLALEEIKIEIGKILDYLKPAPPGAWGWPLESVQEWFEALWDKVVSGPLSALQSFWTAHIQPKLEWVKDRLQESIDWVYNQLKPIISDIATDIANIWTGLTTSISNMWTALATGISDIGSWIWDRINPILTAITTKITDMWDGLSTAVGNVITNITNVIANVRELILDKVVEKAKEIVSSIGTSLGNVADSLWTAISTGFNNVGTWIATSTGAIWDSVLGLASDLLNGMATSLGNALTGFFDWALKQLGWIAEMIGGAAQFVMGKLLPTFQSIIAGFMHLLTGAITPGSPPKEIAVAAQVLSETLYTNQVKMLDNIHHSPSSYEELFRVAVQTSAGAMAAGGSALAAATAADQANPAKNPGFRPTVRELVYWSGIPAVTASIAVLPAQVGLLTPLRYFLNERWTPMIPSEGDLVRFRVREVWHPELRPSLLVGPKTPEYYLAMAKQGYSKEWADSYWAAHWVLPSISQLNEMLYRGIIKHQEWTDFVIYNDYIPAMVPKLEKIIYQPYTRVDIRRMWDIGLVTDEELLENYKWLGYDEEHAQRMTLWTKAYVVAGDVRALYSKGWIDEHGAKQMLVDVGVPKERLDVFMKRLVKLEQANRMADERDLTKTDILRMFKINIFTENEAMSFLMDLGYDEDEAYYLIQVQKYQPEVELKELTMANILKAYRYEIYSRNQAKLDLIEAGWSEQAAETMLKLEDVKLTDAQIEKARERDLTPTQIMSGIKKEVIDANTGYMYLEYLGYSEWEISFLFALEGIE